MAATAEIHGTDATIERTYPKLRDVVGPAAFGGEPQRFRELLWIATVNESRLDYANTVLDRSGDGDLQSAGRCERTTPAAGPEMARARARR